MNYTDTATLGNYRKITISVPDYVYQQVTKTAKHGEVSKFITEAILNKIGAMFLVKKTDPWDDFLNIHKHIGEVNDKITTREAIEKRQTLF